MPGKRKSESVELFEGPQTSMAILAQAGISISMENDRPGGASAASRSRFAPGARQPGAEPSASVPDRVTPGSSTDELMPWGDGNDFPQRLTALYNQDPIIPQTLAKLATMVVGGGIMAVLSKTNEKGIKTYSPLAGDPAVIEQINDFIDTPKFKLYLREMAGDIMHFYNGWPELILSKDRSRITSLEPLNAEECRWCKMDEKGNQPFVYLSANWPRARVDQSLKINALDPYRPDIIDYLREADFYNCVYPVRFPTPGKRYYSLPLHYSIVESGWLEVHLAVPAFKKYLMKNQMTLKYHWKVDKDYWPLLYGEAYSKGTPAQKRALKVKWLTEMTKTLTDVSRAGNSIITDVTWDPVNKLFKDHITVTPISDAMADGKYIADNLEAAANIFYAFGVDPTQMGFAGGEKMGSRSGGSDKREAYLIQLQMLKPYRDMLIEPVLFSARFNGWKKAIPQLDFVFNDTILTTLDTGAGTAKKIS